MLREGVVLYSGGKVKGSHGHIVLTKINDEGENPCDFIQEVRKDFFLLKK